MSCIALTDNDILMLENEWSRIDTSCKLLNLKYNQTLRDIETKVFIENGTPDDLEHLYIEADEKHNQESKGLITRILDWFQKMFNKILDGIKYILTGSKSKDPNEVVEIDAQIEEKIENTNKMNGFIGRILSAFNGPVVKILVMFMAMIGKAIVMHYVNKQVKKVQRKVADKLALQLQNGSTKLKNNIDSLFRKCDENAKTPEDRVKITEVSTELRGFSGMIWQTVATLGVQLGTAVVKHQIKKQFDK